MSSRNQLFLKLFVVYLVLFGALTFLFDYAMGNEFDLRKSAPLFLSHFGKGNLKLDKMRNTLSEPQSMKEWSIDGNHFEKKNNSH